MLKEKKCTLIPLNAVLISRSTLLANVAIEIPPVMTVYVIRPASAALVLNSFIFFTFHELQFHQANMP